MLLVVNGQPPLRESFEIHDDCRILIYVKPRPLSEPKIREGSDGVAVCAVNVIVIIAPME